MIRSFNSTLHRQIVEALRIKMRGSILDRRGGVCSIGAVAQKGMIGLCFLSSIYFVSSIFNSRFETKFKSFKITSFPSYNNLPGASL